MAKISWLHKVQTNFKAPDGGGGGGEELSMASFMLMLELSLQDSFTIDGPIEERSKPFESWNLRLSQAGHRIPRHS